MKHKIKHCFKLFAIARWHFILALSLTDGAGYWTLFALSLGFML